jgi:hypothetical protein
MRDCYKCDIKLIEGETLVGEDDSVPLLFCPKCNYIEYEAINYDEQHDNI